MNMVNYDRMLQAVAYNQDSTLKIWLVFVIDTVQVSDVWWNHLMCFHVTKHL